MKIIEILPPTNPKSDTVRNFLSDTGRAFTTYPNGGKTIQHNGITLYEKKLSEGGQGYAMIKVRRKGYMVHRLVAENFVPNPDNKPVVNHKDMNRRNNNAKNLEWLTFSENSYHAASGGESYVARKRWCRACNKSASTVWCVDEFEDRQVRWRKHRDVVLV